MCIETARSLNTFVAERTDLGPSTHAIVEAAEHRGIPWMRLNDASLVQLGHGRHRKFIQAAMGSSTGCIATDIACDKQLTKTLLDRALILVPKGIVVRSEEQAVAAFDHLDGPVVVKPIDGRQGCGVSLDLRTPEGVAAAFRAAREFSATILVEEMFEGRDFRLLVVDGRLVAAAERIPAHVVGDGIHSIEELVEIANQDPRRGDGHERPLTRMSIGTIAEACLEQQGCSNGTIPEVGRTVYLRTSANLSTGGIARDVTDLVHPSIARLAERAARVVGLDVCGVDLIAKRIDEPLAERGGGIVELNAAPGLRMHCFPSEGQPRDVGGAIVRMLFPEGAPARIPIVAVAGRAGTAAAVRAIGRLFDESGMVAGVVAGGTLEVGGEPLRCEGRTCWDLTHAALTDPSVEVAVVEVDPEDAERDGLGFDRCDVVVLTGAYADANDGRGGLALLVDRVREGGALVLNADDQVLVDLAREVRDRVAVREVVFVTPHENSVVMRRHVDQGGVGFALAGDGHVVEARGENALRIGAGLAHLRESGNAPHLATLLAVVAASRAAGVGVETIAAHLANLAGEICGRGLEDGAAATQALVANSRLTA